MIVHVDIVSNASKFYLRSQEVPRMELSIIYRRFCKSHCTLLAIELTKFE